MKWYQLTDAPLQIHGLAVKEGKKFFRLPEEMMDQVNPRIPRLATYPAGGRIRFRTDSPVIEMRYSVTALPLHGHSAGIIGRAGADCYVNGIMRGNRPKDLTSALFFTRVQKENEMQDVDIYLPIMTRVITFEIGVEDDAKVEAPRPYTIETPFVFYGSSITNGAAASHPGNNYVARVARHMDADFINLGFAGAAKGEQIMADYIAGLDMSLFVLDYDHNAPTVEHLQSTHYPFYETVRKAHPELPIIMLSRPNFDGHYLEEDLQDHIRRREVVRSTYERAKANGDENVYFIDGETLFGTHERDSCTSDTTHPNDLGFYRMAQAVIPVVEGIFKKA